jgi:hypothetical protein
MQEFKQNPFLSKLLSLQQEGSGAISAPSNWLRPPLLYVKTELDDTVEEIAAQIVRNGEDNKTGAWWFLVGSPGNGKSAAVGLLVRTLREGGAKLRLEKSKNGKLGFEISEIGQEALPYKFEVYERDSKDFSSAWLAQDASVVPYPFSVNADPADELIELVKRASEKGVSLVVCANRGVLEEALDKAGRDPANKSQPWFRALKSVSENKPINNLDLEAASSNSPFRSVKVTATSLDTKSLLQTKAFADVLGEATQEDRWSICDSCEAAPLCPFLQNKKWLERDEHVKRLETVLRCAELYSGQVIVFREAVALVSLILAGSTKDYRDSSPCDFVQSQIKSKAYFTLLARRIYMTLFSSSSPFGLESHLDDRSEQINSLDELAQSSGVPKDAAEAIKNLKNPCSTDVGLSRLLSPSGVLSDLDPIKENQGKSLERKWNVTPDAVLSIQPPQPLVSNIEEACIGIWQDLESSLDSYGGKTVDTYRHLRRWFTNVIYRLGFFAEGQILFQAELEDLNKTIGAKDSTTPLERRRHLSSISKQLTGMLGLSSNGVKIGSFVRIDGEWVTTKMAVKISSEESNFGCVSANIGPDGGNQVDLSAQVFTWLDRKERSGLLKETFPPNILQISEDLRLRAASGSGYAFAKDEEVKVYIQLPNGDKFSIERYGDSAHVDMEES